MVMKLADIVEDSRDGIDAWIGTIPLAIRERNISITKYNQISIRYSTGSGKCEYHKLMDGSFKALLYIFKFTDAILVTSVADIRSILRQGKFDVISNKSDDTAGAYINIDYLPQAVIVKITDAKDKKETPGSYRN